MNKMYLLALLLFTPAARAATWECSFSNSDSPDRIMVDIDMKTQFVKAEGPKYALSGYAVKQVSKASDRTFLILPAGVSIPSITIELETNGDIHDFNNGTDRFDCKISGARSDRHDPRASR